MVQMAKAIGGVRVDSHGCGVYGRLVISNFFKYVC